MGTCGLVGPIGVYTGWVAGMEAGAAAPGAFDWIGPRAGLLRSAGAYQPGPWARSCASAGLIAEGDLLLEA